VFVGILVISAVSWLSLGVGLMRWLWSLLFTQRWISH